MAAIGDESDEMGNYLSAINFEGLTISKVYGGSSNYCAIFTSFDARCWGLNDSGQLG